MFKKIVYQMISLLLISLILVQISPLNKNTIFPLAIARISSIILIFSSFLIMNIYYIDRIYNGVSIFYSYISVNSINQIFQIFLLIIGALILATVCSNRYLLTSTGSGAYSTNAGVTNSPFLFPAVHPYLNKNGLVILFNLIGASALITANDMLTLYVAIETQSFSLYLLSTLKNDSIRSATAGLKYFLIGSLASIIILLGIALLYYASGLTNFENLALYFNITDFYSAGAFGGGIDDNSPFNQVMHY
jgi:NADH-ubiquinone oxidoreductase chain 2